MTFVDSSALLAFLDRDDAGHAPVVDSLTPILAELHAAAVAADVAGLRRRSSLVDHVSFEVIRRRGLDVALAVDRRFAGAGFKLLP